MIFKNEQYYPSPGFLPCGKDDIVDLLFNNSIQKNIIANSLLWEVNDLFWRPSKKQEWLKAPKIRPLPFDVLVKTRIFLSGHWNYRSTARPSDNIPWDIDFNLEYKIIEFTYYFSKKPILRLVK